MKTVALVGFASTTRDAVQQSKADEIWTLNWAYKYKFIPRIDRLFEMHPIWAYDGIEKPEYIKPIQHWKWLHNPHPFPIYMLHQLPQVPSCIRYPIEDVTEYIFGRRLLSGDNPSDFYSSSFDYMLALAIYEKWDRIELYGFEMGSLTEYRYQREGSAFFIGNAIGRGITVQRQSNSVVLKTKRYGYEGGQMIFRQDLERLLESFTKQKIEALARVQYLEGKLSNEDDEHYSEIEKEYSTTRENALIASGAEQAIVFCIKELDLEEVDPIIVNPIQMIPIMESDK